MLHLVRGLLAARSDDALARVRDHLGRAAVISQRSTPDLEVAIEVARERAVELHPSWERHLPDTTAREYGAS